MPVGPGAGESFPGGSSAPRSLFPAGVSPPPPLPSVSPWVPVSVTASQGASRVCSNPPPRSLQEGGTSSVSCRDLSLAIRYFHVYRLPLLFMWCRVIYIRASDLIGVCDDKTCLLSCKASSAPSLVK